MRWRILVATGLILADSGCSAMTDLSSLGPSADAARGEERAPEDASDAVASHSHCADPSDHDFCDDFEDLRAPDERWNHRLELVGTGTVALENLKSATSTSTALSTAISRGDDAGTVHIARLSKQIAPWPRTDGGAQAAARIALSIFVRACDRPADVLALCLGVSGPIEDTLFVEIERESSDCRVSLLEVYADEAGVSYVRHVLAKRITPRVWTPIVLAVSERTSWLGSGATVTIGSATESFGLSSRSTTTYFRADVGVSVPSVEGSDTAALYDDVQMDYRP